MGKRAPKTLTSGQISEIIRRGATEPPPALAQEFGVSIRTIARLRSIYKDPANVPKDSNVPLRKRQVNLNYKTRKRIIKRLNAGESAEYLAQKYGVSTRTIHELGRFQESCLAKINEAKRNHKSLELKRLSESPLHKAVIVWYEKKLAELGIDRLPNNIIQQRALQINQELGGPPTFKASNGWLWSFKKQYGLHLAANQDDPLASPCTSTDSSEEDETKIEPIPVHIQKPSVFIMVKEQPHVEEPAKIIDPEEAYRAASILTNFIETQMDEETEKLIVVREIRDRIFAMISATSVCSFGRDIQMT